MLQPRKPPGSAHLFPGGPLVPDSRSTSAFSAHRRAQPYGTTSVRLGRRAAPGNHHFPTSLGSTVVTRFSATTDALTPAGSGVAARRGSLIHVSRTSNHSVSNHLRGSTRRVHSLYAGHTILFGLRLSLAGSPTPPTESSSRWRPPLAAGVTDWSFASRCSPPGGLAPMQLRSATGPSVSARSGTLTLLFCCALRRTRGRASRRPEWRGKF